jgi:hypothetical protein
VRVHTGAGIWARDGVAPGPVRTDKFPGELKRIEDSIEIEVVVVDEGVV